ncbi:MAG: hypothetical protein PHE58_02810 [Candidatus Omnitrophica bacterium]|nr:hypothetical protein [Candidatus Omnitrophota bacterium]
MGFITGQSYTRQEIREIVGGGSVHNYLPYDENGRILCVCLSREHDPDGQKVILVGSGPSVQREAEMFCLQNTAVPVFYKKELNQWEYQGDFKPERWTDDPEEIRPFAESSGRINLTKIIFLQKIE